MPRFRRILLEIFAPPFFGMAILYPWVVWGSISSGNLDYRNCFYIIPWFFSFCVYAYLITGIPSLVYAALMELAFFLGLSPRSWMTVLHSGLLGWVAGYASTLEFELDGRVFGTLGLVVGLVLGALIKRCSSSAKPVPMAA